MARFNVGEAFLQVVASVENIHKTIAAEVAKIKDIQIDVTPNMAGFREKVAAETANMADVDVNVKPDLTGFRAKIRAETVGIGSIDVPVRPDVDTTRANAQIGAFATEMRAKLEAATKALGDIHMTADSSDVDRKIAAVRAQLATLSNQRIGVDIDSAAASAKIKALEAELTSLGARSPNIQVKVDVAKATAELAAFRAILKNTENDGNLVSRALGGFASAVGSALSSLGSFVGSASQVGSTLTSMGSSVSGATTSFASFGQSIGSALSAVMPLLGTAAMWTALGVAIAAAGSIAVGALGQIGGAAIALASGIVPLTTSLGLLPGLLAPLGIGLGTLAIGFSNTGKSGMEFKNTMDQLKSAFQPVIDSIRSQMQPAIQNLLNSFKSLAPVIQSVVPQITSAVSQVTNSFAQLFKSSSFQNDLKTLLSGAAQNIKTFGDAAKNAFQGFMNILVAAQPAVNRIAQDIDQAAQKFNQWTAAARQSGELTQMFQQAATVLEQLGSTLVNIAGLFKDLWDSANRTGAFTATLDAINQGITQFRQYVSDAGGAWDQLMSKAGSVTQSLVGLVGSIGNAFVTLGGQMDISGVIDKITQAINNMTPAFAQIGQAATPVFENLITIIGRMVQALGPQVAQAITAFGDALKSIDWESVTVGIATFIKGMSDIVSVISTVGQAFTTFEQLITQLETGDFAGAGQSLQKLNDLWTQLGKTLTDTSGIQSARQSVQGLNQEIQGIKSPPPIKFDGDPSGALAAAQQADAAGKAVLPQWVTKFAGDAANLVQTAQQADAAAKGVETTHTTTFTGDGAALLAAASGGQTAIQGVVPDWLTKFAGDATNLIAAAQQADTTASAVANKAYTVQITGNADGVTQATTTANTQLGTVQDKAVNITATDQASTVATTVTTALNGIADKTVTINATDQASTVVQAAIDLINGMPDHTSTINVNDQASGVIQQIANQINSLQNRTITITTVYQTVGAPPGQAAGAILPMAPGGSLTPMSGHSARIVPPNSWRIIGDRMHGDEAFIPINNSSRSMAILGQTAGRMGFALVPMMGSGGYNQHTWDWLAELLRRWRGGHGHGSGGGPALPPTIGTAELRRITSSFAFGSSGGVASYLRTVKAPITQLNPVPSVPTPPSTGSGHGGRDRGGDRRVYVDSNSAIVQEVLRIIRAEVRKQGGDVQFVLGT